MMSDSEAAATAAGERGEGGGPTASKADAMSDTFTRARARGAAVEWLSRTKPMSYAVMNRLHRGHVLDAFAAGAEWAITPRSSDDVNQIVAGVIRDAQAAGTDEAAADAALAIFAYLGAIHRGEQDLWGARFAAAGELIAEAAALFRSYEAHHRAEAERLAAQGTGATVDQERNRTEKAERNGKIADKLERWLLDRNPAEVLRQAAVGMVDGETIKGVDHAAFDRAAAMCNEIAVSHVPPGKMGEADVAAQEAFVGAALDAGIDQIGEADEPVISARVDISMDDEVMDALRAAAGAGAPVRVDSVPNEITVYHYEGDPPVAVNVNGVRYEPVDDPEPEFSITTADPRFDPGAGVTINGYRFEPASGR